MDSLTGYENHIFESFPTNVGYLFFSGSTHGGDDEGSHVKVIDFAGSNFPTLSKKNDGENILNPGKKSISLEFQLFVPTIVNQNQVVMQKISGSTKGMTLGLSQSASTTACNLIFAVSSGSEARLFASASLEKGKFNQVCATYNRKPGINKLQLFVNEKLRYYQILLFSLREKKWGEKQNNFRLLKYNSGGYYAQTDQTQHSLQWSLFC